jgi:peroxiredoxin Q/BCP
MLQVGDKIPEFSLHNQNGDVVDSKALVGNWIVIYFYPKDNTPGCTQEACDFRDFKDCRVFGVSKDSVKSHIGFSLKYDLPFDLLSDTEGDVCQSFGVWVEKSMYGKKYFGIQRATFLIDPSGKIVHVWEKVSVKNHASDVLEKFKTMSAKLA